MLSRLLREEDGQTLVEYALLSGFTALAAVAILSVVGRSVGDVFITVNAAMTTAG